MRLLPTNAHMTRTYSTRFLGVSSSVTAPWAPSCKMPDPRRQPAPTRSRRNTFGCNLVTLAKYDIVDKIRELALKGTAIAKRVGSSWASRRRVTT